MPFFGGVINRVFLLFFCLISLTIYYSLLFCSIKKIIIHSNDSTTILQLIDSKSLEKTTVKLADFLKSSSTKPKQFLLQPTGRKLKAWCGQLCACAIKPSSSTSNEGPYRHGNVAAKNVASTSATIGLSEKQPNYEEQMIIVKNHLKSIIEPCSSNSPCCGLEESIEALKQQVLAVKMLQNDENCDNLLKNALLKVLTSKSS